MSMYDGTYAFNSIIQGAWLLLKQGVANESCTTFAADQLGSSAFIKYLGSLNTYYIANHVPACGSPTCIASNTCTLDYCKNPPNNTCCDPVAYNVNQIFTTSVLSGGLNTTLSALVTEITPDQALQLASVFNSDPALSQLYGSNNGKQINYGLSNKVDCLKDPCLNPASLASLNTLVNDMEQYQSAVQKNVSQTILKGMLSGIAADITAVAAATFSDGYGNAIKTYLTTEIGKTANTLASMSNSSSLTDLGNFFVSLTNQKTNGNAFLLLLQDAQTAAQLNQNFNSQCTNLPNCCTANPSNPTCYCQYACTVNQSCIC